MDFYPENYQVTITVPFQDGTGADVTPNLVSAVLTNGDGDLVVDLGTISFNPGDVSKNVKIDGTHNWVDEGIRSARLLVVTLEYPEGPVTRRYLYAVEKSVLLESMTNTFMGYESALLMSYDFVNFFGWDSATEGMRKTALIHAYSRITQIPMKFIDQPLNDVVGAKETIIERDDWLEKTFEDFAAWPKHFRDALRRAQFIEANSLLQGDEIGDRRRAGVISESIGESSMRLSESMIDYGISTQTMDALRGYIHFSLKIGRA